MVRDRRETGFFLQTLPQCKNLGKNPVSEMVCDRPETKFLREIFSKGDRIYLGTFHLTKLSE
ncbi:hypothetical protein [Microcoleus sp. LEGE 07076]|uniref:hypothetical protein n=1 Tax=Microcoleus sp. LEGE 07076 TaxID=915322 RepID=UPI0030DCA74D